mgnify:FL=1
MERKIGEIFNYQDNLYQCIKSITCTNCGFNNKGCLADKHITGDCSSRLDGASVIFRKLEKVGNPIMVENKSYQKIKVPDSLCNNCAFYNNFSRNCKLSYYINHYPAYSCLKNEIFVEIKQNKEDMKEKKLNLKEFNLEAAKAGKPVYTRDGRKVRIICFDAKCIKPIVALIQGSDNSEQIEYYTENGIFSNGGTGKNRDLMILLEKKERWVNIYGEEKKRYCSNVIYSSKDIYSSKEEALNISKQLKGYITTIKIEWEE